MTSVLESILTSVKKLNNVSEEDTSFDNDFILYINGALAELNQLGIGPSEGFEIEDANDIWEDFLGLDPRFNGVKTFVALYVRMRFDPPKTSFHIEMAKDQLNEHKYRLIALSTDIEAEEAENV